MSLLTTTGALALAGIVAMWGTVKLTKWSLQSDETLNTAVVAKLYLWLIMAVVLLKLGPAIGTTAIRAMEYLL